MEGTSMSKERERERERESNKRTNNIDPILQLLTNLSPGTSVDDVFLNGKEESVKNFASFNPATGLATFTKSNGDVLVVNYQRIDAIKFD